MPVTVSIKPQSSKSHGDANETRGLAFSAVADGRRQFDRVWKMEMNGDGSKMLIIMVDLSPPICANVDDYPLCGLS